MDRTQQGEVTIEHLHGVSYVSFFHPAHNSLPGRLLNQLVEAIKEAGEHPNSQVVVLKSVGEKTFCAGASFDELVAISNHQQGISFFSGFANVINAMRNCPKFIIGRVHGKAVGGGVGLAASVDYALATKWSSVKLSELAVGIGPFVVGPAVQRKIGLSAFSQMSINAKEWQTAAWAKEKGLFAEVFDSTEQLDAHLLHFVDTLKNYNPEAMKKLKEIFWEGTEDWDNLLPARAGISGELVLSQFTKEAIAAFKKK